MSSGGRGRWERIESALDRLWEMPGQERDAALEALRAGDPELAAEVERLLRADERAGDFLGRAAADRMDVPLVEVLDQATASLRPGEETFGPYRVERLLGRGGMGRVYLAHRTGADFQQRVALKVLDTAAPGAGERFRAERRILARLEHPNVARFLDGGVTDAGLPWLAMEYVPGLPLTTWCEERGLGVRARVELFERVCDAVRHAHRNLVVHRDLKPSNVLVSEAGEVKLLDFGIAKVFEEDSSDPGRTVTGVRPMTPAYAAPEQVRGDPVTTATDVYGLGALLFELLTGRRPFVAAAGSELERAILESDPPSLSRAASRSGASLRGDLETIVAKALAKEPAERYPTVDALLEDLRRHRTGEPLLARPATFRYRAAKFLRRHRWQSAAAGLIVLLLLGGVAGVAREGRRAERQAERAEQQAARAERMLGFVTSLFGQTAPEQARGEPLTARQILERGAREADSLFADDPGSRAELLLTLGSMYGSLGDFEAADSLLTLAVRRTREAYGTESVEAAAALNALFANLYELDDLDRARVVADEAYRIGVAAAGKRSAVVSNAMSNRALLMGEDGDFEGKRELEEEVTRIDAELYGPESEFLVTDLGNLGLTLQYLDRMTESDSLLQLALDISVRIHGEDHPQVANQLASLAQGREDMGRYEEAEVLYRRAVALRRTLYPDGHPDIGRTITSLAQLLQHQGRVEEAYRLLTEAAEEERRLVGDRHPLYARSLSILANNAFYRADYEAAERSCRAALEIYRQSGGDDGRDAVATLQNLGMILLRLGRMEEARDAVERALAARARMLGEENFDTAWTERSLARVELESGDLASAELRARHAEGVFRASRGDDHFSVAEARMVTGLARLAAGRAAEAEPALREAVRIFADTLDPDDARSREARCALAACLFARGQREEAEAIRAADLPRLEEQIGAGQYSCRLLREAAAR
jgi:serine/threonine-protein kinase